MSFYCFFGGLTIFHGFVCFFIPAYGAAIGLLGAGVLLLLADYEIKEFKVTSEKKGVK